MYLSDSLPDELSHYFKEKNTRCTVFDGREIIITVKNDPYDSDVVSLFFITYGFFNDEPFLVVTYKNKIWQQTVQFDDNGQRLIISPSNFSGFSSNIINELYTSTTTNILNILESSTDILCTDEEVNDINGLISNHNVNHPFVITTNNSVNVQNNSTSDINTKNYKELLIIDNNNELVNQFDLIDDSQNLDDNKVEFIENENDESINDESINESIEYNESNQSNESNDLINNSQIVTNNVSELNSTKILSLFSDFKLDKKSIYKIGKYTIYGLSATAAIIYLKNYLAPKIDN